MVTFLTIVHIFVCLFLILTVLLQAGKGGGMGVALGGGGSQTVFGSSGAGNFLTRLTSVTAAVFMMTSLGLAHYSSQQDSKRLQRLEVEKAEQKKHDDERLAQIKAELEKNRPAAAPSAGGAAVAAPASTEGASTAPSSDKVGVVEKPAATTTGKASSPEKAAATKDRPVAVPAKAGAKPADGDTSPAAPVKSKAKSKPTAAEHASEEAKPAEKTGETSAEKAAEEAPVVKPKARAKRAATPVTTEGSTGEAAPTPATTPSPAPSGETPAAP